ncbi:MAG: hypothetical protein ABIP38_14535 [Steroidobacteraceae bacterium]
MPPRYKRGDALDKAYERLESMMPGWPARVLRWLQGPDSRFVRMPLGILCTLGSFLWFLPVLGLWMLPVGLLLIAQDIPFLRSPVGRITLRGLDAATRLHQRWRKWRASRS